MRKKLLALTMIVGMGAGLLGFNANSAQAAAAKKITLNDAKQIALKHAKLTAKQVKFIKAKSDIENGKKVYDIEFYKGNTEYDYEISATTGKILEYDHDVETYKKPSTKNSISLSKAKSIALKHAKLTAKQVRFVKAKADYDDGVKVYEIEFTHKGMEYEYEISAKTGKILSFEKDRI